MYILTYVYSCWKWCARIMVVVSSLLKLITKP